MLNINNQDININTGVKVSSETKLGIMFEDDRCPVCGEDLYIYNNMGAPIVYACKNCQFCTPIVRDHVNAKMRPDVTGETFKFLSNFGSVNKFAGLTRMAIDRSLGEKYLWDL